jgi:hypothetical protein
VLIKITTESLHRTKWHQFAIRFVFGGAITLIAGVIARKFGPAVGGLFLAFPAIFPAAATLAQTHEQEKKREHALNGEQRGILTAADQSRGTALGSVGAGGVVWCFGSRLVRAKARASTPVSPHRNVGSRAANTRGSRKKAAFFRPSGELKYPLHTSCCTFSGEESSAPSMPLSGNDLRDTFTRGIRPSYGKMKMRRNPDK